MRQNAGFFFLKGAFAHFLLRKFLFQNSSFGASHYVNMVTVKWLQWWLFFVNFNMGVSLIWYESGFNIFKFFLIARNITRNVMGWDGVRVLVQASFDCHYHSRVLMSHVYLSKDIWLDIPNFLHPCYANSTWLVDSFITMMCCPHRHQDQPHFLISFGNSNEQSIT